MKHRRQRRQPLKSVAGIRVMCPQAKEHQGLPASPRAGRKAWDSAPEPTERTDSAGPLFQSSGLQKCDTGARHKVEYQEAGILGSLVDGGGHRKQVKQVNIPQILVLWFFIRSYKDK